MKINVLKSLLYNGDYDFKGEKLMNEIFDLSLKIYEKTLAKEITPIKPTNEETKIIILDHWFENKNNII